MRQVSHRWGPTTALYTGVRLNPLGIATRTSRNTAMLHLAPTLPPGVFATIIGIDAGTATRWADHAGGNSTTYVTKDRRSR